MITPISELPDIDYSKIHTLYMRGGHTINIKYDSYHEYNPTGKREMFVARLADYFFETTRVISESTVAGATDDIVAFSFYDKEPTT